MNPKKIFLNVPAPMYNSTSILSWLTKTNGAYYKKLLSGKTFKLKNTLHVAIQSKNVRYLLELLSKNRSMLFEKDKNSLTPFMYAIKKSYFAIADILLKYTSETINLDTLHYSLFKGIYRLFWLVRGIDDGKDAIYLVLKTDVTDTEFLMNLYDDKFDLEENGIIFASNFGKSLSKESVKKSYETNGIMEDLYHYDTIDPDELLFRERITIKRFLEKVQERYVFAKYLLHQSSLDGKKINANNDQEEREKKKIIFKGNEENKVEKDDNADKILTRSMLINSYGKGIKNNIIELQDLQIKFEKETNIKNDFATLLEINQTPYTELILYDSKNLPNDKTIFIKNLNPGFEYHPDILVILTRMNSLTYILKAIGYTIKDTRINKIVYEPMPHNLNDLLNSNQFSYQNRFSIIEKLIDIYKNQYKRNHIFDYTLSHIDFSSDTIFIDSDYNVKLSGIDFRINVKRHKPIRRFSILIAEILFGINDTYDGKNESMLLNLCIGNMVDMVIDLQKVIDQLTKRKLTPTLGLNELSNNDIEKIQLLLMASVSAYIISHRTIGYNKFKWNEGETTCSICMINTLTARFDCSHTFCVSCAKKTKNCYVCRQRVSDFATGYWFFM